MTTMLIFRYLATILDIAFASILIRFLCPLKWVNADEKPSIVGFAMMIAVYALNVVCIWA